MPYLYHCHFSRICNYFLYSYPCNSFSLSSYHDTLSLLSIVISISPLISISLPLVPLITLHLQPLKHLPPLATIYIFLFL